MLAKHVRRRVPAPSDHERHKRDGDAVTTSTAQPKPVRLTQQFTERRNGRCRRPRPCGRGIIMRITCVAHGPRAKNRQGTKSRASRAGRYTGGYPVPADGRHLSHQMPWRPSEASPLIRGREIQQSIVNSILVCVAPERIGRADHFRSYRSPGLAPVAQAAWRPIVAPEGVRPPRTFTDGAGGFLPGVPLGCLEHRGGQVLTAVH